MLAAAPVSNPPVAFAWKLACEDYVAASFAGFYSHAGAYSQAWTDSSAAAAAAAAAAGSVLP